MFAQSTPISYHTEAFVKTEVGYTVAWKLLWNFMEWQDRLKDPGVVLRYDSKYFH